MEFSKLQSNAFGDSLCAVVIFACRQIVEVTLQIVRLSHLFEQSADFFGLFAFFSVFVFGYVAVVMRFLTRDMSGNYNGRAAPRAF